MICRSVHGVSIFCAKVRSPLSSLTDISLCLTFCSRTSLKTAFYLTLTLKELYGRMMERRRGKNARILVVELQSYLQAVKNSLRITSLLRVRLDISSHTWISSSCLSCQRTKCLLSNVSALELSTRSTWSSTVHFGIRTVEVSSWPGFQMSISSWTVSTSRSLSLTFKIFTLYLFSLLF